MEVDVDETIDIVKLQALLDADPTQKAGTLPHVNYSRYSSQDTDVVDDDDDHHMGIDRFNKEVRRRRDESPDPPQKADLPTPSPLTPARYETAMTKDSASPRPSVDLPNLPPCEPTPSLMEETQKDPDSYHQQFNPVPIAITSDDDLVTSMAHDALLLDHEDDTQNFSPAPKFDENRRFFDDERATKRQKVEHDHDDDTPLADLEPTEIEITLTQLFDASSPARMQPGLLTTSPAIGFSPRTMLPTALQASPRRQAPNSAPVSRWIPMDESQVKSRLHLEFKASSQDDGDESDGSLGSTFRIKKAKMDRKRSAEEIFKDIKVNRLNQGKRRGRPPKISHTTSLHPSSSLEEEVQEIESSLTSKIPSSGPARQIQDSDGQPSQNRVSQLDTQFNEDEDEVENEDEDDEDDIQVPSTAKKSNDRSQIEGSATPTKHRTQPDKTVQTVDMIRSSSQMSEDYPAGLSPTQESAIADSQPIRLADTQSTRHDLEQVPTMTPSSAIKHISQVLSHNHAPSDALNRQVVEMIGQTSDVPLPEVVDGHPGLARTNTESSREAMPSSPPPVTKGIQWDKSNLETVHEQEVSVVLNTSILEKSSAAASGTSVYETAKQSTQNDPIIPRRDTQHEFKTPYPARGIRNAIPDTIPETNAPLRHDDALSSPTPDMLKLGERLMRKLNTQGRPDVSSLMSESDDIQRPTAGTNSAGHALTPRIDETLTTEITGKDSPTPSTKRERPPIMRKISAQSNATNRTRGPKDTSSTSTSPLDDEPMGDPSSPVSSPPPSSLSSNVPPGRRMGKLVASSLASLASPTPQPQEGLTSSHFDAIPGARQRVFAQFKDGKNYYHPATLISSIVSVDIETEAKVMFDDGQIAPVSTFHIKRLVLKAGDEVKVDQEGMKKNSWVVVGTKPYTPSTPSNKIGPNTPSTRTSFTDNEGHNIVILRKKSSRQSTGGDNTAYNLMEVYISYLYILKAQWSQFEPITPSVSTMPVSAGTSAMSSPSSKSVRKTTPFMSNGRSDNTFIPSILGEGLFAGMVFAVSYGDKEIDKKSITSKLQNNGGTILEEGFQTLFHSSTEFQKETMRIRHDQMRVGFACVIADRHSRTSKYLQALALGFPCLAGKWVEDCLKKDKLVPWEDYLLPSGESTYLNGSIKSRVLTPLPPDQARLHSSFSQRKRLFDGCRIIFVMGRGKQDEKRKPHLFLIHAMGAATVIRVNDPDEAKLKVKDKDSGEWNYVVSRTEGAKKTGKSRINFGKHVRVVEDEWVIQSLILGRLLDDDLE